MQPALQTRQPRPRDISYFLSHRQATWKDDSAIGELLVDTFTQTYQRKLPHISTSEERIQELRDVASRRLAGEVHVLELGYRVIGTFALVAPHHSITQSWIPGTANLRCVAVHPDFHGLKFSDLLVERAIDVAQAWQCAGICLHVQQGAHGVARVYTQKGFVRDLEGDFVTHGNLVEGYSLVLQTESRAS